MGVGNEVKLRGKEVRIADFTWIGQRMIGLRKLFNVADIGDVDDYVRAPPQLYDAVVYIGKEEPGRGF